MGPGMNGWDQWGHHVLKELERIDECICETNRKLDTLSTMVVAMRVKVTMLTMIVASVWSVVVSAIIRMLT